MASVVASRSGFGVCSSSARCTRCTFRGLHASDRRPSALIDVCNYVQVTEAGADASEVAHRTPVLGTSQLAKERRL